MNNHTPRQQNNFDQVTLPEEKPLDLRSLWLKFVRRRRLFFLFFIPIFLGFFFYRLTRPYTPVYLASFDLGITENRPVEGFFSGAQETPTSQIGSVTQRVIADLLSIRLAEKVIDSLGFGAFVKNGKTSSQVRVQYDADFTGMLGPFSLRLNDNSEFILKDNFNTYAGLVGEYLDIGPVKLKILGPDMLARNKNYTIAIYPRNRTALALRNSVSIKVLEADKIDRSGGSSGIPLSGEGATKKPVTAKTIFPGMSVVGILRIEVFWGNPGDGLKIAQVLSDQVIKENISEKSRQFVQSREFVESQLSLYQEKLNILEDNIKTFKEHKKIADLKASTQALINQVSAMESRKNQLEIEQKILIDMDKYLSEEHAIEETQFNFATALITDPGIQNLYSQLLQTDAQLKSILKEYSSNHPKYTENKAKYDGFKEQLKDEITKRVGTIKTDIRSVNNQIGTLQVKLELIPADEISLARLERDKETAEKLYTFFSEKLEETRVQEAGVTSDLKIINPAYVSSSPVNPRRVLLMLFISLVIAGLVGSGGVLVAEYFDNTIKDPDQIKDMVGLPIFASIPMIELSHHREKKRHDSQLVRGAELILNKVLNYLGFKNGGPRIRLKEHGIITDTTSAEFEAFRKLSVHLDFAHPEKEYNIIYVVSPGPEEGKTFVALNLGIALSFAGKKVIVIDTDFRKKHGHLSDVLHFKKEIGLFEILEGKADIKKAVKVYSPAQQQQQSSTQPPDGSNPPSPSIPLSFSFLPVGIVPPNPFVFLESEKMRNLLADLRKEYEYVIIDGLPVLLFADATYLASFADGVLITAMYSKTNIKDLENASDLLSGAKSDVLGVVLNNVPRTADSYYYHYYYKYYNKYYRKSKD